MYNLNPFWYGQGNLYQAAHEEATKAWHTAAGLSTPPLLICVSLFSIIGTILIAISVLPQTIQTVKDHQTTQINSLMYIFLVVGCFALGMYGIGLVTTGNMQVLQYYSPQNLSYYVSSSADLGSATFGTTFTANEAGQYIIPTANALSHGGAHFFITGSDRANAIINFIVPGAMLIAGEFFCSITSAIVLGIKHKNQKQADRLNTTEEAVCLAFAQAHPERMVVKKAKRGGNK